MGQSWKSLDKYLIVSSDTHAGADIQDYRPYLAKSWHDEFDAWAADYKSPFDDLIGDTAYRNWESDRRISELEQQGIAAEILIPNTVPPFFPSIMNIIPLPTDRAEYERRNAGVQAHNRWTEAFCKDKPGRRRALYQVFPNDVDDAIAEIRWAKDTGVAAGILIGAIPPNHVVAPLYSHRYDPLWDLCEELDLPVCQHLGSGTPSYPGDEPAARTLYVYENPYYAHRSLWHMILGGVFERHPQLKWVHIEEGIDWIPGVLDEIDSQIAGAKARPWSGMFWKETYQALSMTAWDYFRRNCYAAHPIRPLDIDASKKIGLDRVLWGSDYPHSDATSPYTLESIRSGVGLLPQEDVRQILAGTAGRLFGFDLDALVPVAERVGPTVQSVHTPLPPAEYPDSEWFWLRAGLVRPGQEAAAAR
jgi:predicted TIM-barrel fold metal-dependent hydrolase